MCRVLFIDTFAVILLLFYLPNGLATSALFVAWFFIQALQIFLITKTVLPFFEPAFIPPPFESETKGLDANEWDHLENDDEDGDKGV
jgi:hypothetical protein